MFPCKFNVWKKSSAVYVQCLEKLRENLHWKNNAFCHNFSQVCLSLKLMDFVEIFFFEW